MLSTNTFRMYSKCLRAGREQSTHVHGMPSIFAVEEAAGMGANAKNPQLH